MRPLVIGASESNELARVRTFAEANPIPLETLKAMLSGDHPPPGDYPEWTCEIPVGWRVVFTVADHPMGRCRHLSVSTDGRHQGRGSDPRGVALIAQELGFSVGADLRFTDRQKIFPDPELGLIAPNVVELMT